MSKFSLLHKLADRNSFFTNNCEPRPTQYAPAEIHCEIFSLVGNTPPVGIIFDHGIGPFTALMNSGPPTCVGLGSQLFVKNENGEYDYEKITETVTNSIQIIKELR